MASEAIVDLPRQVTAPFFPTVPVISLELTNNCNLKCPYCANIALTRPKTYIDWDFLEKVVDECAVRGYDLAWLHGVGEPLLWDRLEDVIRLIKQKGAGAGSFGTNGTLLSPGRVRSLLDAGLDRIYVSIDTLDPDIYRATRGGKLAKVIGNVQEMIKIVPPSFQITVALMDHKDQRVTRDTFDQFKDTFGVHANLMVSLVKNLTFPGAPEDYRRTPEKLESCFDPIGYFFIALDGRVGICCRDQDIGHSLGNVRERSIHDIWFDTVNQTTFRNIALGIFDCPDVCTQKCVLKAPKQNVSKVVAGYGLPYDEALDLASAQLTQGDLVNAQTTLYALASRDPKNTRTRTLMESLTALLSGKAAPEQPMARQWARSPRN
jgi:MoaA/NifB/PqqE/SkfB family radical SAM enzyme